MRRLLIAIAVGAVAAAGATASSAAAAKVKITGTYSNLAFNRESGDLSGEEVRLFYVGEGTPVALVQISDSNAGEAGLEAVTIKGDEIDIVFAKPLRGAIGLHGRVSGAGMSGVLRWQGGRSEPFTLRRGKSYWD